MTILDSDRRLIRMALAEDIGKGDITTKALRLSGKRGKAVVVVKAPGYVSGVAAFIEVFKILSPTITFNIFKRDGSSVVPGDKIIEVKGPLDVILTGERTAMNFISHLSGVATTTRKIVDQVKDFPARILDTRKTIPGLRHLQKVAVKNGGGTNHRCGLYDMYLVKENHIASAGGLENALKRVISHSKNTHAKIEIEVKNLSELKRALKLEPDYILLDNFNYAMLKRAVKIAREAKPEIILEASGNINLNNVRKVASTGVDRISIGKMTHSASVLDLSMIILDRN